MKSYKFAYLKDGQQKAGDMEFMDGYVMKFMGK